MKFILSRLMCLLLLTTAALAESPSSPVADETLPPELQTRPPAADIVLPIATVLRVKLDRTISTATARRGERVPATLSKSVDVRGQTVLPAGTTIVCRIDRAHGTRRFRGRPVLTLKAVAARLPNGDELDFRATTIDTATPQRLDVDEGGNIRGADANPVNKAESVALGGSGAIAGVIAAGPTGLLIGAGSGVAIAAGHILTKYRELTLPAGTELLYELDAPATVARAQSASPQEAKTK